MAQRKVMICDRCGHQEGIPLEPAHGTPHWYRMLKERNHPAESLSKRDLCAECSGAYESFINGQEIKAIKRR